MVRTFRGPSVVSHGPMVAHWPPTPADVTVGPVNLPELRRPDGSVISTDVPPSTSEAPAPPAGDYP